MQVPARIAELLGRVRTLRESAMNSECVADPALMLQVWMELAEFVHLLEFECIYVCVLGSGAIARYDTRQSARRGCWDGQDA